MKRLIFAAALAISTTLVNAQDAFTVKMSMKIEGLPPEYAGFGDNEITSYNKGDLFKQEVVGMMGTTINHYDGKMFTMLSDQMGNKVGYTRSKEEMDAAEKKEKGGEKPKIEYTTEKQTIAGYECTKAILTSVGKDKQEHKTIVWVTDKLKSPDNHTRAGGRQRGMDLGDLKGFPMKIESEQNQGGMNMKFVMTTTEVSTAAIDDSVFKISTEGYNMTTYDAFMEKMKAMGGGH